MHLVCIKKECIGVDLGLCWWWVKIRQAPIHAGSGLFTQWLDANGIRSVVKPGGTSYCVIGDLWKRQRETDEEFQGFKTMELENAAKTEQEHADDIRKLVRSFYKSNDLASVQWLMCFCIALPK